MEEGHLTGLRKFLVQLALHASAADWHEVMRVIAEQCEPLLVSMRVEQRRFVVVEALDLVLAQHSRYSVVARTQACISGHLYGSLDILARRGRLEQIVPPEALHPLRPRMLRPKLAV